jgi:predicted nucleotidyltransferase
VVDCGPPRCGTVEVGTEHETRLARFQHALDVASRQLRDEFGDDLVGLLLAGSAAAGTPMRNSDIDLYVLIRPSWRQRRNVVVEGVEVEMFINPAHQIRRELGDSLDSTVDMFSRGQIHYDPHGVVEEHVEQATDVASERPAEPDETQVYFIRYRPSDLLRDTEDLAEVDPVAAEMLLGITLQAVIRAHWELRGLPPPKSKRLLQAVRDEAPDVALLAQGVMEVDGDLTQRVSLLRTLCEEVLEPVGGVLLEGETPREPLDGEEPRARKSAQ